jgi:uncharacterized membrane protein
MFRIPVLDVIGLSWFFAIWIGYTLYADRASRRKRSLRAVMHEHRYRWMRQMLARENRMTDAGIVGNLLHGVSFFASTTLLVLVGLITLLGASDKVILLVRELPFASEMSLGQWELKLLVLIVIFVHAFFKFTWALREFNYCSVLIGAAPPPNRDASDDSYAMRAAQVATHASKDFNQGLRAYYFSLAALAWFVHPAAFVITTTLVVAVLYWREYQSETLNMLEPPSAK